MEKGNANIGKTHMTNHDYENHSHDVLEYCFYYSFHNSAFWNKIDERIYTEMMNRFARTFNGVYAENKHESSSNL